MRGAARITPPPQRQPVKEASVREQSTKLCECGCGNPAPISPVTSRYHGWVKDQPKRFISGHNSTIRVITYADYSERDTGFSTPCWLWSKPLEYNGYGKVMVRKRRVWAHRAMWEQTNGPIPEGLELDHLCRIPSCVRPDHLEAVTHQENMRRGNGTRVTPQMLTQIRELREAGLSHRQIARQVPVGRTTVADILNGHRWA